MDQAVLVISSRKYSSWSLRGWLLARLSGLPFSTRSLDADDPAAREELLLRSASILVPRLEHAGLAVWDTLAIAEYLHELLPQAGMYPAEAAARARCRSISGEMHAGFQALRSSLPMNLHALRRGFPIWSSVQADIDRITTIWRDCLSTWGGPFLFGPRPTVGDAMYAPVATRFQTYDVQLDTACTGLRDRLLAWPDMVEWAEAAKSEPVEVPELEVEF